MHVRQFWGRRWQIYFLGINILFVAGGAAYLYQSSLIDAQSTTRDGSRANPTDAFDMQGLTIPRNQILSGGPSKDGIPSLTSPDVIALDQSEYAQADRMVVLQIGDVVRAYPIKVLNWHEAINDTLGDVPVAVIYCPLCDSVSVLDRRIDGKVLSFGISGLLYQSNVLLYDHQHDGLWSQIGLKAVSGPYAGQSLKHLPWQLMRFAKLRQTYPQATVVSTQTGYQRDYARNPYERYFATDQLMFPVSKLDKRLLPKLPVVGIRIGQHTRAYPVKMIQQAPDGIVRDTIEGHPIVLEADQTGRVSVISVPQDSQVVHAFWFAWSAFHPDTTIYEPVHIKQ